MGEYKAQQLRPDQKSKIGKLAGAMTISQIALVDMMLDLFVTHHGLEVFLEEPELKQ